MTDFRDGPSYRTPQNGGPNGGKMLGKLLSTQDAPTVRQPSVISPAAKHGGGSGINGRTTMLLQREQEQRDVESVSGGRFERSIGRGGARGGAQSEAILGGRPRERVFAQVAARPQHGSLQFPHQTARGMARTMVPVDEKTYVMIGSTVRRSKRTAEAFVRRYRAFSELTFLNRSQLCGTSYLITKVPLISDYKLIVTV